VVQSEKNRRHGCWSGVFRGFSAFFVTRISALTHIFRLPQVSYHNSKLVKRAHVTKDNAIVNKTTKTRREVEHPQLQEQREQRDSAERRKINEIKKKEEAAAAEQRAKYKQEKDARSYDHLMKEDGMVSNSMMKKMSAEEYEDDFM
jgi:flagellar biosynthesis GTPase FlhF